MAPTNNQKKWLFTLAASLIYMGAEWLIFSGKYLTLAHRTGSDILNVMTWSFLFLSPFGLGALINHLTPADERGTAANLLFRPPLHGMLALALATVVKIEGLICVLMAAPIFILMSILGALTYHLVSRRMRNPKRWTHVAGFLLLPIIAAPMENRTVPGTWTTTTCNSTVIHADAATVWRNIIRVRAIDPAELPWGLSACMGFPDPVEATLTREGLGGVRRASFRGNVVFTETIDAWEEGRSLSFTIVPNTDEIPPTTMDEHVIVGGRYFKVLRGTYAIENRGLEGCLLRLSSVHSSTTDFNPYTDAWGRIVMGSIQARILEVIRKRCETAIPPKGGV